MEINEHQIKLSGKANVISGLTNGKNYDLTISDVSVRKIEEVDNDNGTYNRVASLKISELSEVNIISEKEIIKSKKKTTTQSQILRFVIESAWEELGNGMEKEDFYKKEMSGIINDYKTLRGIDK